ncbi:MAG: PEP-CTERM sorting domain-containing protein [Planctomycetes bacterium]|nr:PEP-CTERM sorting domain-containing protein [Planctomycetota bacterium]MBU4399652.1 PEP-CTERM sorting domain-containing protein [Planctomycetota bacterium]MCG2683988.1 PEP-CTERM sorting domain-containing protein [Planctomycetales bacterium]
MSRKSILTALVVCCFALTAVVAQAGTITIANAGFETPPDVLDGPIKIWTVTGMTANSTGPLGGVTPFDTYMGILKSGNPSNPGSIKQTLMDGVNPYHFAAIGDSVSISLYEARRDDNAWVGHGVYIEFTNSDTTVLNTYQSTVDPGQTWTLRTLTYTATTASDLGKDMYLTIANTTTSQSPWYDGGVLVDNVSASYTPIPEPSTLVLLAAGLVGLLCYAWRKRR